MLELADTSGSSDDTLNSDIGVGAAGVSFSPSPLDDVFRRQLSLDDLVTNPNFRERQQDQRDARDIDPKKMSLHHMLEDFVRDEESVSFQVPVHLDEVEREYIRQVAVAMGLQVRHWGVVQKRDDVQPKSLVRQLELCPDSVSKLTKLCLYLKNKKSMPGINLPLDKRDHSQAHQMKQGMLMFGDPMIPTPAKGDPLRVDRETLPIWKHKGEIVNLIQGNKVSIIRSQSGYGKSTQIPQFVVEHCQLQQMPCRVLVCLPNRVAAIALADRVAEERSETVGHTIGYQVRLESCNSPVGSVITFCTGPVLLRALANPGKYLLNGVTHIVMDELQCRSKYQDLVMLILRETAKCENPKLRFVYITNDLKAEWMCEYLGTRRNAELLLPTIPNNSTVEYIEAVLSLEARLEDGSMVKVYTPEPPLSRKALHENAKNVFNVDSMIHDVFNNLHAEELLYKFLSLVRQGKIDANYGHSENGVTMLMACAARGRLEDIDKLMEAGADADIRAANGRSAINWAESFHHQRAVEFLRSWYSKQSSFNLGGDGRIDLLVNYQRSFEFGQIDLALVRNLIKYLHVVDKTDGGILVFLPTYEDLDCLQRTVAEECNSWCSRPMSVSLLHKYVQTDDQRLIFEEEEDQSRKLIIAAGMFETGLTFPKLKFVIDTGRHPGNSDLISVGKSIHWITKSDAEQRLARLGNKRGTCYRLYSKRTFEERMSSYTVPEITRCCLLSLCLHVRSLAKDISSVEFFSYLPNPPSKQRVLSAVESLKQMGAIDSMEKTTEVGHHLLDYPLDPRWAKAALYSCVFKCLDPILTLAAYMAYEDAFRVPAHPSERRTAMQRKTQLADRTFSDYMAILKAFHQWERERSKKDGDASKFCEKYYLTDSTFNIVYGIRTRLLGQLRASGFVRSQGKFDVKDLNKYSEEWAVVKAVLLMTLYPNICVASRTRKVFVQRDLQMIHAHPVSVLHPIAQYPHWKDSMPTDFVVYGRMMEGRNQFDEPMGSIAECCAVNTATVAFLAGEMFGAFHMRVIEANGHNAVYVMDINEWLTLFGTDSVLHQIPDIRERIRFMIIRRLMRPDVFHSPIEDNLLDALVYVLTQEDKVIGFKQSFGVGQWPKLVSGNLLSTPKSGTSSLADEDDGYGYV